MHTMATAVQDRINPAGNGNIAQTPESFSMDMEKATTDAHLQNTVVHSFTWQGVTVTVKDRKTKQDKLILDGIDGMVHAGTL